MLRRSLEFGLSRGDSAFSTILRNALPDGRWVDFSHCSELE